MHKLVVNQVMLNMGLEQSQTMATIFDGTTRHNPEGLWFHRQAQANGFKSAIEWRQRPADPRGRRRTAPDPRDQCGAGSFRPVILTAASPARYAANARRPRPADDDRR